MTEGTASSATEGATARPGPNQEGGLSWLPRKLLTPCYSMIGRSMRVARLIGVALAISAAHAVPIAHGDIIAAVDVPVVPAGASCPSHWDIAFINAATGQHGVLPAGINTSVDELHPSITPFGTRLTFQR